MDSDDCTHVWAPFQMEPFSVQKSLHGATWTERGTRCTKVFCQKCKKVEPIKEQEPETGL